MVSFYKLKYTSFISSDNYLAGLYHEINPESRFLALGTRKNYVVADLNYSCFLARRASLFLFGSLVRRSHPAVSFGHQFYDYEDIFSEFSTLSVSYVRDWVPGLLTNYKALFRTALKKEGALRRIGFFFQFPDILLMFGTNNSIGFIINEARSIQIPTIVTGDVSLSFSQVTYMLLGNYKSFKSTMFFVKLFLDLNSESSRFRILKHYSVFKRLIKSVFLRRTLKSKLFSIKLSRMFFIFRAVPKLRVSQVTPIVHNKDAWAPASFFKASKKPVLKTRVTMRRSVVGRAKRLIPISKEDYVTKRRTFLGLSNFIGKLRRRRLILNKKSVSLVNRRASFGALRLRFKGKALKHRVTKVRLLKKAGRFSNKRVKLVHPKQFRKLLKVAKRRGLQTKALLREANTLVFGRLRKLDNPDTDYSAINPLPIFIPDRGTLRQLFPFLGYFAYGYMAKRLNTLLFYRAIFRQVVQKRKKVLRLKRFTSNLQVMGIQAKKFKSLNLAIHRRAASIFKLRAKVKRFSKVLKATPKLKKLRSIPGFNEKRYMRKLLGDKPKSKKRGNIDRFHKDANKGGGRADKNKNNNKYSKMPKFGKPREEWPNKKKAKDFSKNNKPHLSKSVRSDKDKEDFVTLMSNLYKQEIKSKDFGSTGKPKLLKDLLKINKRRYAVLRKTSGIRLSKKKTNKVVSKEDRGSRLAAKLAKVPLFAKRRALVVRNFTPTQRHMLRVYRILFTKYPSFVKRARAKLPPRPRVATIPRTAYQFLLKQQKYRADVIFKRTGKRVKLQPIRLPRKFRGPKRNNYKGKKPWHKGKNFNPRHDSKKDVPDKKYWGKKGDKAKGPYNPNYPKRADQGKKGRYDRPKNYVKPPKHNDGGGDSKRSPDYHKAKPPKKKKGRSEEH